MDALSKSDVWRRAIGDAGEIISIVESGGRGDQGCREESDRTGWGRERPTALSSSFRCLRGWVTSVCRHRRCQHPRPNQSLAREPYTWTSNNSRPICTSGSYKRKKRGHLPPFKWSTMRGRFVLVDVASTRDIPSRVPPRLEVILCRTLNSVPLSRF